MVQTTQSVKGERQIGPGTGPFFLDGIKDIFEEHLTPQGNRCGINRGRVKSVKPYAYYDQRAEIECQCGTIVIAES